MTLSSQFEDDKDEWASDFPDGHHKEHCTAT